MTNRKAIAIRYRTQVDAAPRVVAKGAGEVADAIIRRAHESDVPVHEDTVLTESLLALETGSVIPEELYAVVAEVLAHVYRARRT